MLAQRMRARIDAFRDEAFASHPFFLRIQQGRFTEAMLRLFLENVLHLVRHTPVHLRLAEHHTTRLARPALAAYYQNKLREEVGHDQWAEDDLKALDGKPPGGGRAQAETTIRALPSMAAMLRYNEKNLRDAPELYLAHILFAEYFTVVATPPMVLALEEKCGIPRTCLSVLTEHAELDQGHVDEWSEVLPRLVDERQDAARLVASLEETMRLYAAFCREIAEAA